MGEVVELPVWTRLPLEPDRVLEMAKGQMERVLVLGVTPEGQFYFASSHADAKEWAYLCGQFIHKLHRGDFHE